MLSTLYYTILKTHYIIVLSTVICDKSEKLPNLTSDKACACSEILSIMRKDYYMMDKIMIGTHTVL